MKLHTISITTDSGGAATKIVPVRGRIYSITYIKGDYDNGVDFTITTETTLQNVWVDTNINASETVYPRAPTHDQTGAALLYAAGGTAVSDFICIDEGLKFVIAQGGNAKSGTFYVVMDE